MLYYYAVFYCFISVNVVKYWCY